MIAESGTGTVIRIYGSAKPEPKDEWTAPQHWLWIRIQTYRPQKNHPVPEHFYIFVFCWKFSSSISKIHLGFGMLLNLYESGSKILTSFKLHGFKFLTTLLINC